MGPLGSSPRNTWSVSAERASLVRPVRPPRPVQVAALPKPLTLDLARTAAVVIDMQNDFCTAGGWLHGIGVDVAPTGRAVAGLAAVVPALRDAGVPIVWVNWGNRPDRLNLSPALLHVYDPAAAGTGLGSAGSNGPVLERGSWGAAVVDALQPAAGDIHVDKFRMSGFWDTPLDSILRNLRVDTVLFGGVNADQCVMATLQDANFLGYDTVLLEDCSATTSPQFCWDATVYNVRQCFGFTMSGVELAVAVGGCD